MLNFNLQNEIEEISTNQTRSQSISKSIKKNIIYYFENSKF